MAGRIFQPGSPDPESVALSCPKFLISLNFNEKTERVLIKPRQLKFMEILFYLLGAGPVLRALLCIESFNDHKNIFAR